MVTPSIGFSGAGGMSSGGSVASALFAGSAIVVANAAPSEIKNAAKRNKRFFGDFLQVCGATGNQTQINAAIAAVKDAGGGTIRLSSGEYSISGTITYTTANVRIRIVGDGAWDNQTNSGTLISVDADVAAFTIGPPSSGFVKFDIEHFTVRSEGNTTDPIVYNDVSQSIVESVYVDADSVTNVFVARGCISCRFNHLFIQANDSATNGFRCQDSAAGNKFNNNVFTSLTIHNAATNGLAFLDGNGNTFIAPDIEGVEGTAYLIQGGEENVIISPWAESSASRDMNITGGNDLHIIAPRFITTVSNENVKDAATRTKIYGGQINQIELSGSTGMLLDAVVFTGSVSGADSATDAVFRNCEGFIQRGERRTLKGSLSSGNANDQAFAEQNPESVPVAITRSLVDVKTAGGTASSLMDVGSAADATTSSDNLIDGADINTPALYDNIDDQGTNGKSKQRLDAKGGATDHVTGTIVDANAGSLTGNYLIEYVALESG